MKKTGILTFHDTTNFGAVLQAVATYKAIRELGADCEIINYHCSNIDDREIPKMKCNVKDQGIKSRIRYIYANKKKIRKHNELMKFLEAEVKVSDIYYTRPNISEAANKYERFLVGSDMLWCVEYTASDYTYMLDFVNDNSKKAAFATSVGIYWEKQEKESIKDLLSQFKVIAVREQDTAELLTGLLGKNIRTVCDPTMLLAPEIWKSYAKTNRRKRKYCLVYMDDKERNCLKCAQQYSKKNHLPVYVMGLRNFPGKGYRNKAVLAINEFLGYIMQTQILFTASYHGMLFAIYFHVPFVFYNKDNSRLVNLAEKLGVSGRNGNLYNVAEMEPIDWKSVDTKREEYALFSNKILSEIVLG